MAAHGEFPLRATRLKTDGQPFHPVAVAHPHLLLPRLSAKETGLSRHLDLCRAVLPLCARRHVAAQRVGQQLQPVADAQHRHAALQDKRPAESARPTRRRWPARPKG